MEEKAKKLASQHWFRQRINVAYCSGAGISYTETLAMMDEEVLAAILIINEIEEKQKNRHNKEVNQMVYFFTKSIDKSYSIAFNIFLASSKLKFFTKKFCKCLRHHI